MIRKTFLSKSNTVTGVIGPVHGKKRFHYFGVGTVEMLEQLVNSFGPRYFFSLFVVVDACGQIGKYELAAAEILRATGAAYVTNFRKIAFCRIRQLKCLFKFMVF